MKDFVGLPYTKGSDTSKAAAESMVEPAKNQRQEVWEYIHRRGSLGATSDEIKIDLGFHHSSTTRLTELVRLGRVIRTEKTRPTRFGRQAKIHMAVDPADWTDQRVGWPCPKKPMKLHVPDPEEVALWRKRAYEQLAIVNRYKAKYGKLED